MKARFSYPMQQEHTKVVNCRVSTCLIKSDDLRVEDNTGLLTLLTPSTRFECIEIMYPAHIKIQNGPIGQMKCYGKDLSKANLAKTHFLQLPSNIKNKHLFVDNKAKIIGLSIHQNVSVVSGNILHSMKNSKYKTEFCKNFIEWSAGDMAVPFHCQYADKCNFAHGPNDLARFSSLYDLHARGVIKEDPDTYLCLPCFDHVATGSCPMGSRCHSLHDPRVRGPNPAWLERCTKPKKESLHIIPDRLYHHRDISRFQTNPIVDYRTWKMFHSIKTDAFEATYDLVCNINVPVFDERFVVPQCATKLSELQRLCIVCVMTQNQDASHNNFTYSNKHCINGQACLVLQTRFFHLLRYNRHANVIKLDDIIQEVPYSKFDLFSNDMVQAHEIVFESKGKFNCNRSIWFDAKVTPWEGRNMKGQVTADFWRADGMALFCMPQNETFELNLPRIMPYVLMQPKDDCQEVHDLISSILEHRIKSILASQGCCSWVNPFSTLKADFVRLQKITQKWTWPSLTKHQVESIIAHKVREDHTNSKYVPITSGENTILPAIWSAFVQENSKKMRLDVFESITMKDEKESCNKVPHIANSPTKFVSQLSEQTWKDLLLGQDGSWMKAKLDFDARSHFKEQSFSAKNQ